MRSLLIFLLLFFSIIEARYDNNGVNYASRDNHRENHHMSRHFQNRANYQPNENYSSREDFNNRYNYNKIGNHSNRTNPPNRYIHLKIGNNDKSDPYVKSSNYPTNSLIHKKYIHHPKKPDYSKRHTSAQQPQIHPRKHVPSNRANNVQLYQKQHSVVPRRHDVARMINTRANWRNNHMSHQQRVLTRNDKMLLMSRQLTIDIPNQNRAYTSVRPNVYSDFFQTGDLKSTKVRNFRHEKSTLKNTKKLKGTKKNAYTGKFLFTLKTVSGLFLPPSRNK